MKTIKQTMALVFCLTLIQLSANLVLAGDCGSSGNITGGSALNINSNRALTASDISKIRKDCQRERIFKPIFEARFQCTNFEVMSDKDSYGSGIQAYCADDSSKMIALPSTGQVFGLISYLDGVLEESVSANDHLNRKQYFKIDSIVLKDHGSYSTFKDEDSDGLPLVLFEYMYYGHTIVDGTNPDGTAKTRTTYDRDTVGTVKNVRLKYADELSTDKILFSKNCREQGDNNPLCQLHINTKSYVQCLQSRFAGLK